MHKLFDDWETFSNYMDDIWDENNEWEDDEDWDDEEYEYVIAVTFQNSQKHYHYFTKRTDLNKGQLLEIRHCNRTKHVIFRGYLKNRSEAKLVLDIISIKQQPKKHFKQLKRGELSKMRTSKFTKNVKESLTEVKDVSIKMQKGQAVIAAIKSSLLELDIVPAKAKELLMIPGYSDLVIGSILSIAASTFTDSEIIIDAANDANFVGSVEFSKQFTFIQDAIEKAIKQAIPEKLAKKAKTKPEKIKK